MLEYVIITGIIFTGKDESESLSPDYVLFHILPLLFLSFDQDLPYFYEFTQI